MLGKATPSANMRVAFGILTGFVTVKVLQTNSDYLPVNTFSVLSPHL
jgi:hypothetical protein